MPNSESPTSSHGSDSAVAQNPPTSLKHYWCTKCGQFKAFRPAGYHMQPGGGVRCSGKYKTVNYIWDGVQPA